MSRRKGTPAMDLKSYVYTKRQKKMKQNKYTFKNTKHVCLRVEFLLKTDSGYPKDTGVNKPWQPLGIPFAITSISQLHQSPPSPISGDLGRGHSRQSHVLEHKDTYGQAQVCSKGHQGSSVDRPCQPSFHLIKFWHVRNPLPQSIRLRLSVLMRDWAGQGE